MMESVQNKYGSIKWGLAEDKRDYVILVYDENGNPVVGRDACRKKRREIMDEEERLAKENDNGSTDL